MSNRDENRGVLSIVVPVFNEAGHLDRWCDGFFRFDFGVPTEVIFVDDASTDDSFAVLERYREKHAHVRVLRHEKNVGKGSALRTGIAEASGDFVIIQDADFEYKLSDVPRVVGPLYSGEADVVYGSRFKSPTNVHRTAHYAVNRFLTLFSNVMSGLYVTDMETCYKAFRREVIQGIDIQSPRFGFEPEITAKIAALKLRVQEVPISYYPRNYLEGKKIRWTDGVAAVWQIVRYNADRKELKRSLRRVPDKYRIDGIQWL
ncbi:MAG: glycosyltransferase family 2 protein [Myxococcota bacterium]